MVMKKIRKNTFKVAMDFLEEYGGSKIPSNTFLMEKYDCSYACINSIKKEFMDRRILVNGFIERPLLITASDGGFDD